MSITCHMTFLGSGHMMSKCVQCDFMEFFIYLLSQSVSDVFLFMRFCVKLCSTSRFAKNVKCMINKTYYCHYYKLSLNIPRPPYSSSEKKCKKAQKGRVALCPPPCAPRTFTPLRRPLCSHLRCESARSISGTPADSAFL